MALFKYIIKYTIKYIMHNYLNEVSKKLLLENAFYINLERSKDRNEMLKEQFKKVNLYPKRFEAIDGRKINRDTLDYTFIKHTMENGQLGCALSHIELLKTQIKNNWEFMTVFEDDIIFCDDFWERFNEFAPKTPLDFDILYLGNQVGANEDYGVLRVPTFCNHGLIYSINGAKKIINYIEQYGLYTIDCLIIDITREGLLNNYVWHRKLKNSDRELYTLYEERSSGLVFQRKDIESTIHK